MCLSEADCKAGRHCPVGRCAWDAAPGADEGQADLIDARQAVAIAAAAWNDGAVAHFYFDVAFAGWPDRLDVIGVRDVGAVNARGGRAGVRQLALD